MGRWLIDSIGEPVLSVMFPPRCVGCGTFETHLCEECRPTLVETGKDSCPRCGEPGRQALVGGRCLRCMDKQLEYVQAKASFCHQGVARDLVVGLKFGGQPVLGRLMADLARPAFDSFVDSIGPRDSLVVTWVPSYPANLRERGYNQAELLSRWLTRGARPVDRKELVRKTVSTRHQKGLGRADRLDNLCGVFSVDAKARSSLSTSTRAVVLVDDVFTTGATAREVSSVLRKGTELPVHVFTFSRAASGTTERHD